MKPSCYFIVPNIQHRWMGQSLSLLITFCLFLQAGVGMADVTNKPVQINLPTNLKYLGDFLNASKYETNAKPISLTAHWTGSGRSGKLEYYSAVIEGYPYLRREWKLETVRTPFGTEEHWAPIQPVMGVVQLIRANTSYDKYGEPLNHMVRYKWISAVGKTNQVAAASTQ